MRLIDADAVVQYLHEFRCADCDRRKGLKNGKIQFCYEIGDAPCRACDIGDTIEYFLDEDIAPTIDAIPVEWFKNRRDIYLKAYHAGHESELHIAAILNDTLQAWWKEQQEQEAQK